MDEKFKMDAKYIVDVGMLNAYNERGCEACNQKFNLGDTVVMACGPWPDGCTRLIHESEAVFDKKTGTYVEKNYFHSTR